MFCPECGNTESPMVEGICQDCFLKKFSLLKVPKNIEVNICARCNAKFEEGKWEDSNISDEEIIYRALERGIEVDPLVENEEIELEILQMRGTIAECNIEAAAKVFGETIQQSFESEVRLRKTVCPTCSKQNSGYYEAVIQFRADSRELTPKEAIETDNIVNKTLNNLFEKDKLAYLVQKANLKEGSDYYIGSYKSGKKVADAIKSEFGGVIKESPRLTSQDKSTGKGLYRIWVSVRLPKFKKGDFIKYISKVGNSNKKNPGKIAQIISIDGKKITALDLATYEKFSIAWKEYESIDYLKGNEDLEKTTVISKSPNSLQILDPGDYSVVDLAMNPSLNKYEIGEEIEVIKIENILYLVSKNK